MNYETKLSHSPNTRYQKKSTGKTVYAARIANIQLEEGAFRISMENGDYKTSPKLIDCQIGDWFVFDADQCFYSIINDLDFQIAYARESP